MAESGIFISSCSRREWARRRSGRSGGVAPGLVAMVVLLVVLAMALAVVVFARGGI
jgi:hypothetical protein